MKKLLIAILLLATSGGSPAAALEAMEQRIAEQVEAHNDDALELLQRTVDINSGTMNFAGVREIGAIFASELDGLGFATTWIDGAAFDRAGHLVAEHPGSGPHLLLIGHLDTVFEPDSPFQRFERLSPTTASGPGTTDMKGGDVVLVYALKALAAVGALDGMHITVVMTGDEEKSGRPLADARRVLLDIEADIAIGFEDGDGNPDTAVISRRGSTSWQLTVRGVPAHSSQIFTEDVGAGAIYEATRSLHQFYERLATEPNLTFNPGVMLGGTQIEFDPEQARGGAFGKNNVVARDAVVSGDIRALSPEQYERAKETMLAIVADHLPRTNAELTFSPGYPPMAPSEGNRRLLEIYSAVSQDLGFGPVAAVDPRKAGAADVAFVAGRVPMVLDGVGLMGRGGHTLDETADLATLPMQTQRVAVLLYRLRSLER
jgi:glutamate carboxypeptidase